MIIRVQDRPQDAQFSQLGGAQIMRPDEKPVVVGRESNLMVGVNSKHTYHFAEQTHREFARNRK